MPVCAPDTETNWFVGTFGVVVDGSAVVFGDGCGNEAGAGLIDDVGGCWSKFLGVAPKFKGFRPRPVCNKRKIQTKH